MPDKARSSRTHCHATVLKPMADNDVTGRFLYGPMLAGFITRIIVLVKFG